MICDFIIPILLLYNTLSEIIILPIRLNAIDFTMG